MTGNKLRKPRADPQREGGYASGLAVEETSSQPSYPWPPVLEPNRVPAHCAILELA